MDEKGQGFWGRGGLPVGSTIVQQGAARLQRRWMIGSLDDGGRDTLRMVVPCVPPVPSSACGRCSGAGWGLFVTQSRETVAS